MLSGITTQFCPAKSDHRSSEAIEGSWAVERLWTSSRFIIAVPALILVCFQAVASSRSCAEDSEALQNLEVQGAVIRQQQQRQEDEDRNAEQHVSEPKPTSASAKLPLLLVRRERLTEKLRDVLWPELVEDWMVVSSAALNEPRHDRAQIRCIRPFFLSLDDLRCPNRPSRSPFLTIQRMLSLNDSTSFSILTRKCGSGPRRRSCIRVTIFLRIRLRTNASATIFASSSPLSTNGPNVRSASRETRAFRAAFAFLVRSGRRSSLSEVNFLALPVFSRRRKIISNFHSTAAVSPAYGLSADSSWRAQRRVNQIETLTAFASGLKMPLTDGEPETPPAHPPNFGNALPAGTRDGAHQREHQDDQRGARGHGHAGKGHMAADPRDNRHEAKLSQP